MTVKTTVRLPDSVASRLRERSDQEGRSLNETTVRAIRLGLGDESHNDDWWLIYGDLVAVPPKPGKFDFAAHKRRIRALGLTRDQVRLFMDDFDREREDRL